MYTMPTFFAAPRLTVVVVFFAAGAFALPASAFLGTGFFAAAVLEVVAFFAAGFVTAVLDLVPVAFAAAVFPVLGFEAEILGLAAGLFCETNRRVRHSHFL